MMEGEAKKWEEAEEKDFHLKSEKKTAALSDASRRWFLEKEIHDAQHPCDKVSLNQRKMHWDAMEQDLMERVRNLRQRLATQAQNRCQTPHLLAT